jgi:hypothetical protein
MKLFDPHSLHVRNMGYSPASHTIHEVGTSYKTIDTDIPAKLPQVSACLYSRECTMTYPPSSTPATDLGVNLERSSPTSTFT